MSRFVRLFGVLGILLGAAPLAAHAQEGHTSEAFTAAQPGSHVASEREIDIMHHLADKHTFEYPCLSPSYICEIPLPQFAPVKVGSMLIDFSPTKHLMYVLLASLLIGLIFILSAGAIDRAHKQGKPAKGFAGAMEATALYIRQEVILPNVGHHGEGFVPYLLTVFFFILACNLLGLVPWGAAATGNIAITGALALMAFVVIEIAGMRSLGFKGYMGTIFFLPPGLPTILKPIILLIMTPIEIIGKLAKPFALAVRLFANMTAGHALVLALIGLTFTFGSLTVGIASSLMATAIMLLEVFVAFLQAFVFTLLTAVFIGLMREAH
ncbi:MAG: F0F1 ATP synthase subunit A [Gemmatimonadota bacterium]